MTGTEKISITEAATVKEFDATRIRLTYAHCDPAGIVYFATWFPVMESMLSGWLHDRGLRSDKLLERFGFATITRQAECEYLSPAALFDEIRVAMTSATVGRTSIQWGFEMIRPLDGVMVGRGKFTLVIIDGGGAAMPVPPRILDAIAGD